ncbi:MAG: universal stress protein [Methanobacteriota archaeon]|nr:MAG: universal stress protein [Euryarchaeota archaeon]
MIKKVLVGVDIGIKENMAVEYAASLCKILDAELVVLHVVEELQVYSFWGTVPALKREEILKEREELVNESQRLGKKLGIKMTGKIVEGISPSEELLREARDGKFDLIVVGCHGRSVLMECLLGGVSSQLIHHSKIPILVVKSRRDFSGILMCTEGSKHAEDAINYASDIAVKAKSEVMILSVAPSDDPKIIETAGEIAGKTAEMLKEKGVVEVEAKVRTGHPAEEILTEAREGDYPLLVLGYKGTSAVADLLLGDVASKVMHHSRRPTLVFREDIKSKEETIGPLD